MARPGDLARRCGSGWPATRWSAPALRARLDMDSARPWPDPTMAREVGLVGDRQRAERADAEAGRRGHRRPRRSPPFPFSLGEPFQRRHPPRRGSGQAWRMGEAGTTRQAINGDKVPHIPPLLPAPGRPAWWPWHSLPLPPLQAPGWSCTEKMKSAASAPLLRLLQAPGWSCCLKGVLWCSQICNGEWCQGL